MIEDGGDLFIQQVCFVFEVLFCFSVCWDLIVSFYRWENRGFKEVKGFIEVIERVGGRVGIGSQNVIFYVIYIYMYNCKYSLFIQSYEQLGFGEILVLQFLGFYK